MKHITESYSRWQHRQADKMRLTKYRLLRDFLAETLGMVVFVAYSTGVAAQAKLYEGDFGLLMDVSTGYASGWALGLLIAGSRSPGMCNPCIGFLNMLTGRLDPLKMLVFWLAELIGSILGALLVMGIYMEKIWDYTKQYDNGVLSMGSTGVIFTSTAINSTGSLVVGQVISGMFTFMAILAILDRNNWDLNYFYVIIYAAVAQFLVVNDFTVHSTSIINPAFDFGGRIALSIGGWGSQPFTYANYSFWIFLVIPFVGAILGLLLYEFVIGIHLPGAGKSYEEDSIVEIE
nr:Aquaporin 9 (AQP 9) (Small solute channel 1) [Hymenolepis microstoma]